MTQGPRSSRADGSKDSKLEARRPTARGTRRTRSHCRSMPLKSHGSLSSGFPSPLPTLPYLQPPKLSGMPSRASYGTPVRVGDGPPGGRLPPLPYTAPRISPRFSKSITLQKRGQKGLNRPLESDLEEVMATRAAMVTGDLDDKPRRATKTLTATVPKTMTGDRGDGRPEAHHRDPWTLDRDEMQDGQPTRLDREIGHSLPLPLPPRTPPTPTPWR